MKDACVCVCMCVCVCVCFSCMESGLTLWSGLRRQQYGTAGPLGSGLMAQSRHRRISTFPVLSHLET